MTEQPRSYWRTPAEAREALENDRSGAVEAVAKALFAMSYDAIMWDWATTLGHRQTCLNKAFLAVKVATPIIGSQAWEEGKDAGLNGGWDNPYEERKMTPAEIEEWRKTCPYPEALGK